MASTSSHTEPRVRPSQPEEPTPRERTLRAFREQFGSAPDAERVIIGQAPGRVNLLGDHTDYNGGFVLPATIDRAVYVALRRRADQSVRLRALSFEGEAFYPLSDPPFDEMPLWARYVAGVAEELRRRAGGLPAGFEGVIYGNVPLGAGLSSSAALEVSVALTLDALFSLSLDPVETAKLCQHVEHEYVGTKCGIMDQFASRLGRAGHALFLDCRSLDYEHIPLPLKGASSAGASSTEACFVIADSGVSRELADSKYNERRGECDEAVRFFQQFEKGIETLRDVSSDLFEEYGEKLPDPLFRRARHVVTENRRVEEGAQLLAAGDLEAFGRLMDASHASLRDDYEVSAEELDVLAETAQGTEHVLGARMTGAGFGGCTVTLARREALPALRQRMRARYAEQFGREPELYVVEQNLEARLL